MATEPPPRVIVVDDDAAIRDSLSAFLGAAGYEVDAFADGEQFLAAGAHIAARGVVIDLNLPGVDGFGVLERLARYSRGLPPTVLITGRGDAALRRRAITLGALALLDKPIDGERLVAMLELAAA